MATMPKPWKFDPFRSVRWQAYLAAILAAVIYLVLWVAVPPGMETLTRLVNLAWHETWHFCVAWIGGGAPSELVLSADGSGHVTSTQTSPFHGVAIAAAGLLGVAVMAASFWYAGITRNGLHGLLTLFGIGTLVICYFFGRDLTVCLTLAIVGGLAVVVGYMPAAGFAKSVVVLLFAICLTFGVLDSLSYAFVETVPATPDPVLSDSKLIADALGTEVNYVGTTLVAAIVFFFAVAAVFAASWLQRHG